MCHLDFCCTRCLLLVSKSQERARTLQQNAKNKNQKTNIKIRVSGRVQVAQRTMVSLANSQVFLFTNHHKNGDTHTHTHTQTMVIMNRAGNTEIAIRTTATPREKNNYVRAKEENNVAIRKLNEHPQTEQTKLVHLHGLEIERG